MAKDNSEEVAEPVDNPTEGVAEPSSDASGSVKVPEDFQKKATSLVASCDDLACINFLYDEVNTKRTVLQKANNKENTDTFDKEGMPEL